jgi:ATP-binding cassette subfamily B protein
MAVPSASFGKTVRFLSGVLLEQGPVARRRVGFALISVWLAAGAAALGPLALKALIDGLSDASVPDGGMAPEFAPGLLAALYARSILLARVAGDVRSWLYGMAEQSILRRVSRTYLHHMMKVPLAFHTDQSTGVTVQVLENGRQGLRLLLQHVLFTLIPGLIELALMMIVIATLFDPEFLLIFCACVTGYLAVFGDGARKVLAASRDVSVHQVCANSRLTDALLNVETVKCTSGERAVTDRYDDALTRVERGWAKFYRTRCLNGVLVALVFVSGLAVTLWIGLGQVLAGSMSLGGFVLVHTYMLQAVRPVELLGYGARDIGQGAAFTSRIAGILDQPGEPEGNRTEFNASVDMPAPLTGAVQVSFEHVDFAYKGGHPVLTDLSFTLEPGKVTALVGPSGSGKSSIARLLLGLYAPQSGRIILDGVPIEDWPRDVLRERIALVPQEAGLFNTSLAGNISFPVAEACRQDIELAMRLAGLDASPNAFPEGLETRIGERGLRLSGGERQRIAIARAILRRPGLLIADEATSSLDRRMEAEVSRNLFQSAGDATLLIIAHRLSTIVQADRILVLDHGKIIEEGTHETLLAAGGTYAAMWLVQ